MFAKLRNWSRDPFVWAYITVFCIAAFLRLYDLTGSPNGLNIDESQNAYIGRYIFENGEDPYGQKWPIFYADKRGDYPPVLPMYVAALGTYLLGPTIVGARIMLALSGVVTMIPLYVLAYGASQRNRWLALVATTLFVLSPWHISLSRVATEGTLALFFCAMGLVFVMVPHLTTSVRPVSKWWRISGAIACMSLAILTYPSYRILVPLLLMGYIFWEYVQFRKVDRGILFCIMLSCLFMAYVSTTEWGRGRFAQTSYLHKIDVTHQDNPFAKLIFDEKSAFVARMFYNKYTFASYTFVQEYIRYFSLDFLMGKTGQPSWFTTSLGGLLLGTQIVLIVIGIRRATLWSTLIYTWILLAPIPAALTNELTPSIHRALQCIFFYSLAMVPGIRVLATAPLKKISFFVFPIIVLIEVTFFVHTYFAHINLAVGTQRQTGRYEVIQHIASVKNIYDEVWWFNSGWPQMDYLYFTGKFRLSEGARFQYDLQMPKYENIRFIRRDCPSASDITTMATLEAKLLIITNCDLHESSHTTSFSFAQNIYGKSTLPMYKIYTHDRRAL